MALDNSHATQPKCLRIAAGDMEMFILQIPIRFSQTQVQKKAKWKHPNFFHTRTQEKRSGMLKLG